MINQRTLREAVTFAGIGLHTGVVTNVKVKPAAENHGVVFRRVDLNGGAELRADLEHLKEVNFSITLGTNGVTVKTVEHLLAALAGMGIDNALIELDSPEMPGMDGSAKPFVEKFLEAGVVEQAEPKKFIKIKKPIEVALDGKFAMILPHPEQKISYTISFDHPVLNRQHISFNMNEDYFTEQIASARTFGFLKDAEELRKLGLAKGVSLDNSIVIGEKRILNERLRYSDEFVRHKVLDFIGDLSLMGRPIIGHLIALKAGHQVNTLLCGKVKEREDSWELVDGNGIDYLYPGERVAGEPVLAAEAL